MKRRPLLWALILSALVHAIWLIDANLSWPWQKAAPDEVLERKQAEAVKRVKLAAKPPRATSTSLEITLLPGPAERLIAAPATLPTNRAMPSASTNTAPVMTDSSSASPADTPAVVAEPTDAELTFPLSVLAKQRAHYYGFTMDLSQQWLMEGTRYVIRNEAQKFGFKAEILSEGNVSVDGLQPERYQLSLNNTLRNYAQFDRNQQLLLHGKAGQQKVAALTADMQDMASLPFHVAVTYEGSADRKLMVTTGSSVYEITLQVIAEETLKLPGGTVKTIHLRGNRTRTDGTRQEGYNIWLAPDYRNFPVRFSGPDSKGNLLEMSVSSLAFDGKKVFGNDLPAIPDNDSLQALPAQARADHLSDITPATPVAPSTDVTPPAPEPSAAPEPQASASE